MRRHSCHDGERPDHFSYECLRPGEALVRATEFKDPSAAEIDGVPAALDAAYDRAAEILRRAKNPLIYGLSRSTTAGQRAAAALADRLGATIDTTASTGHAPSIMALQQVGESTCTLGEVKQRADLVIFWGCDPLKTHPRHIERYCPPRPGRTIVVVDEAETESATVADIFVRVTPGQHWEALWTLRLAVKGSLRMSPLTPNPSPPRGEGNQLADLAERMKSCRFGIVFFGAGITKGPNAQRTVEALLQLVTDLNKHTRFYARRMRRFGDVAGADSVLTWQFGYPFGVNLAAGYPRYNPGEFTGPDMLARKEVDACLLVGGETIQDFPAESARTLAKHPRDFARSAGSRPVRAGGREVHHRRLRRSPPGHSVPTGRSRHPVANVIANLVPRRRGSVG